MPHQQFPAFQRSSAMRLRGCMTEAEKRLWYLLCAHRFCGASFRRQTLVGPYVVDFVTIDGKLIVEVDGPTHASVVARSRDAERSRILQSLGFHLLRFTNVDVYENIEGVLEMIGRELGSI